MATTRVRDEDILLLTEHGSRLYGLAHAESDHDFYCVMMPGTLARRGKPQQTIVDGIDTLTIGFERWMPQCDTGVPQALEAMFAPNPMINRLGDFREDYYPGTFSTLSTFQRTLRAFAYEDAGFKRNRHALRLALYIQQMLKNETGQFNPSLNEADAKMITEMAAEPNYADYKAHLESLIIAEA